MKQSTQDQTCEFACAPFLKPQSTFSTPFEMAVDCVTLMLTPLSSIICTIGSYVILCFKFFIILFSVVPFLPPSLVFYLYHSCQLPSSKSFVNPPPHTISPPSYLHTDLPLLYHTLPEPFLPLFIKVSISIPS